MALVKVRQTIPPRLLSPPTRGGSLFQSGLTPTEDGRKMTINMVPMQALKLVPIKSLRTCALAGGSRGRAFLVPVK